MVSEFYLLFFYSILSSDEGGTGLASSETGDAELPPNPKEKNRKKGRKIIESNMRACAGYLGGCLGPVD